MCIIVLIEHLTTSYAVQVTHLYFQTTPGLVYVFYDPQTRSRNLFWKFARLARIADIRQSVLQELARLAKGKCYANLANLASVG